MSPYDAASFTAGQEAGTRVAACVARLAALELIEGATFWNHHRRKVMAGALVACAEELEATADANELGSPGRREPPPPAQAAAEA